MQVCYGFSFEGYDIVASANALSSIHVVSACFPVQCCNIHKGQSVTGGERTRVSADTLVKMAEDSFIASVNYRQIWGHCAFIGDPYFLRLLSLVWGTLRRSFKSWWSVIQPWFRLEKLRGDEGDAHFSFPGVEGDCFPCRGWRHGGRGWCMLNWPDGDWHITLSFQLFMSPFVPCSILPDLKHNKPNQLLGNAEIKDAISWNNDKFWHRVWYFIDNEKCRGVGHIVKKINHGYRYFSIGKCIRVLLETMQIM